MGFRHRQKRPHGGARGGPGYIRIIGGQWRGRRLAVPQAPGLRPSGDRVRETLFNWLQSHIAGVRCADLFAGTGVLGFEAASRGAKEVILVERSAELAQALRDSRDALGALQVGVVNADALEWLAGRPPESLDLVFVDPPFDSDLVQSTVGGLKESACLATGALVYIESHRLQGPVAPRGFLQFREKTIGEVRMTLLQWRGEG